MLLRPVQITQTSSPGRFRPLGDTVDSPTSSSLARVTWLVCPVLQPFAATTRVWQDFPCSARLLVLSAFSSTYDPWTYVDNFGRSKIYKSLSSSYRAVLTGPEKVLARSGVDDSVADESALKPASSNKRRRLEKGRSRSSTSSVVGESAPGTSKS